MLRQIDWPYLRGPLIVLAIGLAIAAVLAGSAVAWTEGMAGSYKQQQRQLKAAHTRFQQTQEEQRLLDQYRQEYDRLTYAGVIGEENRLTWVEAIRDTNKVLKLPKFGYAIRAQNEYARPGMKKISKIDRRSSTMSLDLGLIHEGDLFTVMDGLRAGARGLYSVENCRLQRSTRWDSQPSSSTENLRAVCLVDWLTVDVSEKERARQEKQRKRSG